MKNLKSNLNKLNPYIFVLPLIITILVFYLYPVISTIIMSFQNVVPGETEFIGLKNYEKLGNQHFFAAVKNSFIYTIITIAILIPFPLIIAVFLNSDNCPGKKYFRAAFFIPSLVSVVVTGIIIRLSFAASDKSIVNAMIGWIGIPPQSWTVEGPYHAMFLLVLIATWRWTGINIIYFLSGLQNIPKELYEAADIDGANGIQKFLVITLPMLKPIIIFVTTISIFGGFSMFEESYIIWQGNSPNNVGLTMVGYIYRKGFQSGDFGMGSAIGLVLLVIVLSISLIQLRFWGFYKKEK